jgi:hypothetical protein
MRSISFQTGNMVHTVSYSSFRGVDFSTDPFLVDRERSPWAPNLISDTGGMPEKRVGWRTLAAVDAPVNGLFQAVFDGQTHILVHAGTRIYRMDAETYELTLLMEEASDQKSAAVFTGGALYLFTGSRFLIYDGETLQAVEGRVPEIIIGRDPTDGGGTPLEDLNLIQPKWTEGFLGTLGTTVYQLSYGELDDTEVTAQKMDGDGDWTDLVENTHFTVNRTEGTVTFTTAPGASPIAGQDNVKITAAKAREGYADRVNLARSVILYQGCLFAAGAQRGMDTRSGFEDPTYWPDTGYDQPGSDETDIMGYLAIGEYLAVIKEDNEQDATVFLRHPATVDDLATFTRVPAVTGIGAVSRKGFGTLRGDPLFVSRQGVFALTSNAVTAEKMVQNRSYFVDFALSKESELSEAAAMEWDGYFLVCAGSNCYILDGKQNRSYRQQAGDYVYECYHWTNIPARCFLQRGGVLYFGTADGRVCRFNTDIATMRRYSDDGAAIAASWSTKADDDGDFMRQKHMLRAGSGILIKPYTHSSARVLAATEKDFGTATAFARMDIFDLDDLDFQRFSFNTSDRPQIVPFKGRVRRYQTLQFTVENSEPEEGFGVYGIIKRYQLGGYAR